MSAPTEEELMKSMTWLDCVMTIGFISIWPGLVLLALHHHLNQ